MSKLQRQAGRLPLEIGHSTRLDFLNFTANWPQIYSDRPSDRARSIATTRPNSSIPGGRCSESNSPLLTHRSTSAAALTAEASAIPKNLRRSFFSSPPIAFGQVQNHTRSGFVDLPIKPAGKFRPCGQLVEPAHQAQSHLIHLQALVSKIPPLRLRAGWSTIRRRLFPEGGLFP